jgi:aerobic carbon-monoxide dehydrogenase medium subunit
VLDAAAYFRAQTLSDAAEALGDMRSSRVVAGGTHLLPQAIMAPLRLELLVDVKGIDELHVLHDEGRGIRIGAATTHHELSTSRVVKERLPALAHAAGAIASRQVRNRATIGGNICAAEPSFDLLTILAAAEARVRLHGPFGLREISVQDFVPTYGACTGIRGELVESVWVPAHDELCVEYVRCTRSSFEAPLVGAAIALETSAGHCRAARVVLGNYGPGPTWVAAVEAALTGARVDRDRLEAAAAAFEPGEARADVRATPERRGRLAGWAIREAARSLARRMAS